MRLSPHDRNAICAVTTELAGSDARVLLFGSRIDDTAHGGDTDLLVELPTPAAVEARVALAARIGARIERRIGARRIDVLVTDSSSHEDPVLQAARRHGIAL